MHKIPNWKLHFSLYKSCKMQSISKHYYSYRPGAMLYNLSQFIFITSNGILINTSFSTKIYMCSKRQKPYRQSLPFLVYRIENAHNFFLLLSIKRKLLSITELYIITQLIRKNLFLFFAGKLCGSIYGLNAEIDSRSISISGKKSNNNFYHKLQSREYKNDSVIAIFKTQLNFVLSFCMWTFGNFTFVLADYWAVKVYFIDNRKSHSQKFCLLVSLDWSVVWSCLCDP